jgi:hypothetical protein
MPATSTANGPTTIEKPTHKAVLARTRAGAEGSRAGRGAPCRPGAAVVELDARAGPLGRRRCSVRGREGGAHGSEGSTGAETGGGSSAARSYRTDMSAPHDPGEGVEDRPDH